MIERSIAYNNGRLNTNHSGPVGIWAYNANHVVIQYNEAYGNRTAGGADGGGFDLDGGTQNSVMQYNYSHDNDGPGFLLCQYSGARPNTGNIVRYNISQNDARRTSVGAIHLYSTVQNAIVQNNTVTLRHLLQAFRKHSSWTVERRILRFATICFLVIWPRD